MVALLISMAVTAVWMTAALPAWRHQVQREKEAELIFRGEAIARAIYLYRQKNGQNLPPSLDTLVSQRYLRKKYIDPITGKDFLPVAGAPTSLGGGPVGPGQLQGGIIGVRSTSNEPSIRVFDNQQTYSQFRFDFDLEQRRVAGGPPTPDQMGPLGPGGAGGIGGVRPGGTRQSGGSQGGLGGGGRPGQGGVQGGRGPGSGPISPPGAGGRGPGGGGVRPQGP